MPLENVGKITAIKFNNNSVELVFDIFENIKISEETYTNHYFFVNKEISKEEYNLLINEDKNLKLLKYTLKLVSSRIYTEKEITLKLKQKKAKKEEITKVINYLKYNHLLDDKKYAIEYKVYLEEKNIGKNTIIYTLKNKGITQSILNSLVFSEETELQKAKYHLAILEKKYKDRSNKSRIQLIYQSLLRLGFDMNIINDIIKEVELSSSKEEEEKIKKELLKVNYQLLDEKKIIKKLLSKGYNYELVKKIVKGE